MCRVAKLKIVEGYDDGGTMQWDFAGLVQQLASLVSNIVC
jgi:hypothetical protein